MSKLIKKLEDYRLENKISQSKLAEILGANSIFVGAVWEDSSGYPDCRPEFYAAFESGDIDRMADVWERSDRATVVHPGWPRIQGWAKVAASLNNDCLLLNWESRR